ncbi:MAG: hypothetical protein ACI35S_04195 [Anaeroplasma sp.]
MKNILKILCFSVLGLALLSSCNNSQIDSTDTTSEISTSKPTNSLDDENIIFTMTALYPDGTPLTNAKAQWCIGDLCMTSVDLDANGKAEMSLDKTKNYVVHISSGLPEGYTYNANLCKTNAQNKDVIINLIKLSSLTGEGTVVNPYVATTGSYSLEYSLNGYDNTRYITFTPTEAGKYAFESFCDIAQAFPPIPVLFAYPNGFNAAPKQYTSGGYGDNFKYEFECVANETYYFSVMVRDELLMPRDVEFSITKL